MGRWRGRYTCLVAIITFARWTVAGLVGGFHPTSVRYLLCIAQLFIVALFKWRCTSRPSRLATWFLHHLWYKWRALSATSLSRGMTLCHFTPRCLPTSPHCQQAGTVPAPAFLTRQHSGKRGANGGRRTPEITCMHDMCQACQFGAAAASSGEVVKSGFVRVFMRGCF